MASELEQWVKTELVNLPPGAKQKMNDFLGEGYLQLIEDVRYQERMVRTSMDDPVVDAMVECGFFLTDEQKKLKERADSILLEVSKLSSMEFGVVQAFEGLPWPSLLKNPSGITTLDKRSGKLWLIGRERFTNILSQFLGSGDEVTELDGTVGGGKTYLLLMLVLHCMHKFSKEEDHSRKRLVCLFRMPRSGKAVLEDLRSALLLAFSGDSKSQNMILFAQNLDELDIVITKLKRKSELYFVFDEYNVLEKRNEDAELQVVWKALTAAEFRCPSLHGGSASQAATLFRLFSPTANFSPQFAPFTQIEMKTYCDKLGLAGEPPGLYYYTGYLPLLVKRYLDKFNKDADVTQADEDAGEAFVKQYEVLAQTQALKKWFKEIKARRLAMNRLTSLMVGRAELDDILRGEVDLRWIVENSSGRYSLVSGFAATVVSECFDFERGPVADWFAMKITELVINECSAGEQNASVLGVLSERLLIQSSGVVANMRPFTRTLEPAHTDERVLFIPTGWRHPCVDFVVRCVEGKKLHIDLFRSSLGLKENGKQHWLSAPKCFRPENLGVFASAGYDASSILWTFHWIGRAVDAPHWFPNRSSVQGSMQYQECYHTFEMLGDRVTTPTIKAALKALNALK